MRRKQSHAKKPQRSWRFHWGFPVGDVPADAKPVELDNRSDDTALKKRGIAMLIAIFMTAMMMLFTSDMIVNATVDAKLASANRDNIKAEYMAKSGVNMAVFLVTADLAVDLTLYEFQGKAYKPADGPQDMWGMLNGFPIGGETIEMVASLQEGFDLSKVNDSEVLDQLQLFDGQFILNIEDEASKINVNYCAKSRGEPCMTLLKALMSCPAEKEFLERKKLDVNEIVGFIRDWADFPSASLSDGPTAGTNVSSENDAYSDRTPKVSVKNAPYDSLDELKMIPGWDEDLHQVFSPYLTVYPIPPSEKTDSSFYINFNSADRAFLSCLLPKGSRECAENAAMFASKRAEIGNIQGADGIRQQIGQAYCETDKEKTQNFTYRSDVYRIRVTGEVGDQKRIIEAVIHRRVPDDLDKREGFKGAYKYLYWKML